MKWSYNSWMLRENVSNMVILDISNSRIILWGVAMPNLITNRGYIKKGKNYQ